MASNQSSPATKKKPVKNPSYYQTSSTQSVPIKASQSTSNSKVSKSPIINREKQPTKKQEILNLYPTITSTSPKSSKAQPTASKTQVSPVYKTQTLGKSASSSSSTKITNARTVQKTSPSSLNIPVNTKPVSNSQKSSSSNAQKSKATNLEPTYNKNNFKGKGNIIDG